MKRRIETHDDMREFLAQTELGNIRNAAPELLEALESAKQRITELHNENDCCWLDWPGAYAVDAAIAKARGQQVTSEA